MLALFDEAFRHSATWKTRPRGLLVVQRHPPLGDDFLDAQFSHHGSPLRLKLGGYILNRNARELECHSLLGMRDIVVSMRQISASHETAGSRSRKIRKGNRVSAGVGLIDESERNCVHGSCKRIFTIGAHVPRIFMQGSSRQKARRSFGSARGDGIPVESSERPASVLPLARVVAFRIRHVPAGGERREDKRGRPKRLMGVDRKFISEGKPLRIRDRQKQYRVASILRTVW